MRQLVPYLILYINHRSIMKKIIYALPLLYSGLLMAGAILRIDRVDLLNGQKLIFLAEQHTGEIKKGLDAKNVCQKQFRPLDELFKRFVPRNRDYVLLLESHEALQEFNKLQHSETGFPLVGCEPGYLDRFYLKHMYDQEVGPVNVVANFDERTKNDWWMLNAVNLFRLSLDAYEKSGFNDNTLNEFRKKFGSMVNGRLNPNMRGYLQDFEGRLDRLRKRIACQVIGADVERINNLINWRTRNLAAFVNLVDKAAFAQKSPFEFLFDIAQMSKNQFYTQLNEIIVGQSERIREIHALIEFPNIIADLSLLDTILQARYPNVIISCGADHAEKLITYFFKDNPRVLRIRSLDMLADQMQNVDYASARVSQFVLGE